MPQTRLLPFKGVLRLPLLRAFLELDNILMVMRETARTENDSFPGSYVDRLGGGATGIELGRL